MNKRRKVLVAILSSAIILGAVFLSTAFESTTSTTTTMPKFRSGVSTELGVAVDFDEFSSRVGVIYDVIESDDTHIIWKFTGTTGDWAFVYADGRLVVASKVDLALSTKDTLEKELNDVIDLINVLSRVSQEEREQAIDHATYYASEAGVYHRIKYSYDTDIDYPGKKYEKTILNLILMVPDVTKIKKARFITKTFPCKLNYQEYYKYSINGKEIIAVNGPEYGYYICHTMKQTSDITGDIFPGVNLITVVAYARMHLSDTLLIEAITSPATKNMVLYSDDYSLWIEETTKSLTLDKLMSIIEPCYPRNIHIEAMQPESNFSVIKATAVPISVNVTDNCGNSISSASVQVAFENGDTTLLLAHVNEGIYNGTWVPWNVGHGNVTITAIPPSWQTLKPESIIINGTVYMCK